MQGLLDQYTVAGNGKALEMVVAMAGYFGGRVRSVIQRHSIERHWRSLNEETGGMNDVLYQLYAITVNQLLVHFQALLFVFRPCLMLILHCTELIYFVSFWQNDQKHLVLAHLFDKPCFLGLLAVQVSTTSSEFSFMLLPFPQHLNYLTR
jgi:hypothetical protein